MDCAEALDAKGGKTSTKYVAPTPNVGASGGTSAQLGQRCTWINEFKTFVFHSHKLLSYSTDISSISFFPCRCVGQFCEILSTSTPSPHAVGNASACQQLGSVNRICTLSVWRVNGRIVLRVSLTAKIDHLLWTQKVSCHLEPLGQDVFRQAY
jgi:hypothetical protein